MCKFTKLGYLLISLVLILVVGSDSFGQIDQYGNPVFHSFPIGDDTLANCVVHSNYYSIANNIDNPGSAVYVSDSPSLDEILVFAQYLPSYFFLITTGNREVIHAVTVVPYNTPDGIRYSFLIINPVNGQKVEMECSVNGDITMGRAVELMKNQYDPKSAIQDNYNTCVFNNRRYTIQSFYDLKEELFELIERYKLYSKATDISQLTE